MNSVLRLAISAALAMAICACASKPRSGYVSEPAFPLAEQMAIELRHPTRGIALLQPVRHGGVLAVSNEPGVAAAGLGLYMVGQAIDETLAANDERRITPISDALAAHDYRRFAVNRLQAALDNLPIATEVELTTFDESEERSALEKRVNPRRPLLLIEQTYYFFRNFKMFRVEINARVGDRELIRGRVAPLWRNHVYQNRIVYDFPLRGGDEMRNAEERAVAWFDLGPEALDAMVREGIVGAIDLLVYDLSGAPGEQSHTKRHGSQRSPDETFGRDYQTIADDGVRRVVRRKDRSLRSFPTWCVQSCPYVTPLGRLPGKPN